MLFYELIENASIESLQIDSAHDYSASNIKEISPEQPQLNEDLVVHKADGKFNFDYVEELKKLLIEEADWLKIFDQNTEKYKTGTYVTYFADRLNAEYKNIPCVIKSGGNYATKTEYVVRLECSLNTCDRKYRLIAERGDQYPKKITVFYLHVPFIHEEDHAISRHTSGQERKDFGDELVMQYPVEHKNREIKIIRGDPNKLELYQKNKTILQIYPF